MLSKLIEWFGPRKPSHAPIPMVHCEELIEMFGSGQHFQLLEDDQWLDVMSISQVNDDDLDLMVRTANKTYRLHANAPIPRSQLRLLEVTRDYNYWDKVRVLLEKLAELDHVVVEHEGFKGSPRTCMTDELIALHTHRRTIGRYPYLEIHRPEPYETQYLFVWELEGLPSLDVLQQRLTEAQLCYQIEQQSRDDRYVVTMSGTAEPYVRGTWLTRADGRVASYALKDPTLTRVVYLQPVVFGTARDENDDIWVMKYGEKGSRQVFSTRSREYIPTEDVVDLNTLATLNAVPLPIKP